MDMDESSTESSDSGSFAEDALVGSRVLPPPPDDIPSSGQQFSFPTEYNLDQALLSLLEPLEGLPKLS